MIIKKDELKAKTSEYIHEMIAKAENYVAAKLIKASANCEYKVHIACPDDIPWWALEEVGIKYQSEGYITDFMTHHLWIVIDDEVYRKKQEEDSKRGLGMGLLMKKDKCGQCGRTIKPDEETMHVETRCMDFYLCSKCIVESKDYWVERMNEALANREKVEGKE